MNPEIKLLIHEILHGEATDADRDRLSQWVAESDENAEAYYRMILDERAIKHGLRRGMARSIEESAGDMEDPVSQHVLAELARAEAAAEAKMVDLTPAKPVSTNDKVTLQEFSSAAQYVFVDIAREHKAQIIGIAAAAAIALAVTLFIVFSGGETNQSNNVALDVPSDETSEVPVDGLIAAVLLNTDDAQWEKQPNGNRESRWESIGPIANESVLRTGERYRLTNGMARLETVRGSLVVLEAPCTFEIIGDNWIGLSAGKMVGHCPTPMSQGFTVNTPGSQIVDLGTRFGVEVDTDGETELEVISGEVSIAPVVDGKVKHAELVVARQSAEVRGGVVTIAPTQHAPDKSAFAAGLAYDQSEAWPAYLKSVHRDPALIAHYTFENPDANDFYEARGQVLFDGRFTGASRTQGRHPDKQALSFSGIGWEERAILSVEASEQLALQGDFTVAMWVNIRSLEKGKWATLVTKGNNSWRLMANSGGNQPKLIGFYQSRTTEFGAIHYESMTTPNFELNRWHHVVITGRINGETTSTRMYIDGVLAAEKAMPPTLATESRVAFGAADAQKNIESLNFDGKIGEIAFYNRALSEDEVSRMSSMGSFLDTPQRAPAE